MVLQMEDWKTVSKKGYFKNLKGYLYGTHFYFPNLLLLAQDGISDAAYPYSTEPY